MSIRFKIIGLVVAVFAFVAALTYLATATLVQSQFGKIESNDVQQNAGRAVDAANNRVQQLSVKLTDWSSWDDTYQFVLDKNKDYQVSNLQNGSLMNLDISYMIFINDRQQIVFSKGVDAEKGLSTAVPADLLAVFKPDSSLLATTPKSHNQGFVETSVGTVFVAAKPILTSASEGPLHGTLVFAQIFSPAEVEALADLTHLKLDYYPLSHELPADVQAARSSATATTAAVTALSSQQIAGYRVINDIFGQPLLMARVELPRTAFLEARNTLNYYFVTVLIVCLMAITTAIYTTNQIVRRDRTIQLKNEFFSMASHELRTPLAAIRGNSQLITTHYGPKNDAVLTELADDIHLSSERLIKIVTNFLDAARLESGKLPLNPQPMKLREPVNLVVKQLTALAGEKQLYVRSKVPASLPLVMADAERVQQVVYNLAGNAMKFTESGGITIRAEARGNQVVVLVSDTGRGMTAEQQKLLFHKFSQTRSADASNGSGLGLYISKLLMERMGGQLWLESSRAGSGTTLAFGLPVAKDQTGTKA